MPVSICDATSTLTWASILITFVALFLAWFDRQKLSTIPNRHVASGWGFSLPCIGKAKRRRIEYAMSAFAVAIGGKADIANSRCHVCF